MPARCPLVCGIDIGGTKMELAIFDESLGPVGSWRLPTPTRDYGAFLDVIADMVARADTLRGQRQAVGLAVPGVIHGDGLSVSLHVPCINGKRVIDDIQHRIGRTVAYDNDVRAFTLSESRGGALSGAQVAMGIIMGTGVGGTLCIDGKLHSGHRGVAGEYGHMPIPGNVLRKFDLPARRCVCGAVGCAEQYISGPGLLRNAYGVGSAGHSVQRLLQQMRSGSASAERTFDAFIEMLGYFISRLTLMLDPEVVVLGGGLSTIDEIYDRLPAAIGAYLFEGVEPPTVAPPKYGGAGGARGAAILAHEASVSI